MFNQNEPEQKLDWMYKSSTSLVDRDDYLLGKSVDKSLELLNAEEKQKELGLAAPPKNHVEHECIPPSIRDYKLQQQIEDQVDLQAKLQEDPLLVIRKREEETRRQFLQNPVQLKKLQKALDKQKRKKSGFEAEILAKLKLLNKGVISASDVKHSKKRDNELTIIIMHKFNKYKNCLSEKDFEDISKGVLSETDDSSSESSSSDDSLKRSKHKKKKKKKDKSVKHSKEPPKTKVMTHSYRNHSDSDSYDDEPKKHKQSWGLVKPDGTKIPLNKTLDKPATVTSKQKDNDKNTKQIYEKPKKRSEEEKEKLRREMLQNGASRDLERAKNLKKHREIESKDEIKDYNPAFVHRELLKSANNSTVESRIKANLNNIQRSGKDMSSHFSRRT